MAGRGHLNQYSPLIHTDPHHLSKVIERMGETYSHVKKKVQNVCFAPTLLISPISSDERWVVAYIILTYEHEQSKPIIRIQVKRENIISISPARQILR